MFFLSAPKRMGTSGHHFFSFVLFITEKELFLSFYFFNSDFPFVLLNFHLKNIQNFPKHLFLIMLLGAFRFCFV